MQQKHWDVLPEYMEACRQEDERRYFEKLEAELEADLDEFIARKAEREFEEYWADLERQIARAEWMMIHCPPNCQVHTL